ncbi:MAG: hypothetical protein JOZ52_02830 [Acidobacteria bacterium]|nr:hypothetical protein [Acidobacteriota bacterium]
MNTLAYSSQKIETIGPKIEEKIREEVGAPAPLAYEVEEGGASKASLGSVLGDIAGALIGGEANQLYYLHFNLQQPRPAHLQVSVSRQGVGSHVGLLLYSAPLSKPVGGEVNLEDPKTFGNSKFTGDAAASERLNAQGDLVKRVNKLARTESSVGGLKLTIKRCCKIVPQDGGGSLLVISTLPRPTKMGFSATVDAKEFFDLAGMVEAAL